MFAYDGTKLFESDEENIFVDGDGTRYEMCWRCEEYFPEEKLIVGNIDGIFCEDCDEEMMLDSF